MNELLKEIQKECGDAIAENLKELYESGKEDVVAEAKHVGQGMLKLGKALIKKDKSVQVAWGSLQRQIMNLHAVCYRRGYQKGLDTVHLVAGIVLSVVLRRLGV